MDKVKTSITIAYNPQTPKPPNIATKSSAKTSYIVSCINAVVSKRPLLSQQQVTSDVKHGSWQWRVM